VYNDAGLLLKNLGNMQLAKEYVGIALKLRGSNPTKLFLAQSHHSMGDILLTDGDYQSALHHFTQSKKILKQFNHIYGLTYALLGLGKTYTALGDYELGNRYLLEALENASVQGNGQLRGEIYLTLASAHQKQNNFVRAEDFANNAMNLSLAIKSAPLKGQALKTLANLAEAQGKYQQSLTYYQRYIDTELDKRDKQHQSAYIALDTARKEYIQQLQHSKLLDTNKRQSAEIQRLTSLSQVFAFFSATLMVLLFSTSFFKRKALKQAEKDLLTGAWNRAAAIRDIKKLPKIKDDHYKYLVILLDLDDFKLINDQYGHPTGDAALSHVSELILQHCNTDDIFGRLGGEEFVIVMRNLDELDIQDKVMSLHKAIANTPFRSECNKKLNVTASFSYLATSKSLADFNELYSILDQALYQVKQKGKNSVIDAFNEPIYLEKSAYVPTPP
jgi:diguanylate cyclase (GGDEF)-like protein